MTFSRTLAVGLCEFESVVDPDRTWRVVCREIRVIEVTPCDAAGRPV